VGRFALIALSALFLSAPLWVFRARAEAEAGDAWPLYERAAKVISDGKVWSPSSSNLHYAGYPPFPPEWQEMEKAAWERNAPARALVHEARSMPAARWPRTADGEPDTTRYFSEVRALANEVGDAALYQHLHGEDAAAIESIRDLFHLADLLEQGPKPPILQTLVGMGIRSLALEHLEVITSAVTLSKDAADTKALKIGVARALIQDLLHQTSATVRFKELLGSWGAGNTEKLLDVLQISEAERGLAAMSLACHIHRFEHGAWPASIGELAASLPQVPLDPCGDGKQTLGYVLAKGELPDGSDRPMVFSRWGAKDGLLFYRVNVPQYEGASDDASGRPAGQQKQGGRFRDVARWAPGAAKPGATTRALGDRAGAGFGEPQLPLKLSMPEMPRPGSQYWILRRPGGDLIDDRP
jgi:hypothetical protein